MREKQSIFLTMCINEIAEHSFFYEYLYRYQLVLVNFLKKHIIIADFEIFLKINYEKKQTSNLLLNKY